MVMLRTDTARRSASHNGYPVSVHRQRGTKVFFHQALQDRKLFAIPGIHYFDAHRLRAHLLQAPSDEERDTTDAETDAETVAEEAWCPPMPDAPADPTESEIAGAADKLETMMRGCKNLNEPSTQLSEFQILFAPLTNRSHKAQNQVS